MRDVKGYFFGLTSRVVHSLQFGHLILTAPQAIATYPKNLLHPGQRSSLAGIIYSPMSRPKSLSAWLVFCLVTSVVAMATAAWVFQIDVSF